MDSATQQQTILDKASLCVKCGLCLPHCPTYQLTQDENESPRGRITLMQGMASGMLPLNSKLETHLDQCLSCRHCERVCPANVPYGSLIDHARAFIRDRHPHSVSTSQVMGWLIRHAYIRKTLGFVLWLYQQSGIRKLVNYLKLPSLFGLARLESLLPDMQRPLNLKPLYPAHSAKKGTVSLFAGCMSDWADPGTLRAGLFALQACGFDVQVPKTQTCCGAMACHSGDTHTASALQVQNELTFLKSNVDAIIHLASGCGATLKEYPIGNLPEKITDISHFLVQHLPQNLKPIRAKVLLHTPCTLRNVCKEENAPLRLLQAIPELEIIPFSKISYCCGSAGTYMIEHAEFSDALSNPILEELKTTGADYLVTSNVGCAIHLRAALKRQGSNTKVVHPIYFLAEALK
jgi:glycolate oxidase iron-sulfur subunit